MARRLAALPRRLGQLLLWSGLAVGCRAKPPTAPSASPDGSTSSPERRSVSRGKPWPSASATDSEGRDYAAPPSRRPITRGASDFYFDVPRKEVPLGEEPGIMLRAGRTFPNGADGSVIAVLTQPDGNELEVEIYIGTTETTAFCLPAKGSSCEHDRRSEPFHSTPLYFGMRDAFEKPGRYRLDLKSRRFSANTVELLVTPTSP